MTRRAIAVAATAGAMLGAMGCGGDDGDDASGDVVAALRVTAPAKLCGEALTDRFVGATFRSDDRCRRSVRSNGPPFTDAGGAVVRGDEANGRRLMRTVLPPCLVAEGSGRAAVRSLYETGLRRAYGSAGDCVVRRLRRTLSTQRLARGVAPAASGRPDAEVSPEVVRAQLAAGGRCGAPRGR